MRKFSLLLIFVVLLATILACRSSQGSPTESLVTEVVEDKAELLPPGNHALTLVVKRVAYLVTNRPKKFPQGK